MTPDLVVVVSASLSSNALGRAATLAELVPAHSEVELWGPSTRRPWPATPRFPIHALDRRTMHRRIDTIRQRAETGQRVVFWLSKSYPFAIDIARALPASVPIVVDFDDHDIALADEFRARSLVNRLKLHPLREGSPSRVTASQRRGRKLAAAVTVSSFALATELGIADRPLRVPHARPSIEGRRATHHGGLRIGFLGTMRPHKGIEEITQALAASPDLRCVTFAQPGLEHIAAEQWELLDPNTPLSDAYLGVDAAVLPMSDAKGARFQFPAKAVDAASAGVPIVGSRTPVMDEYFGPALLEVSDWPALADRLERWRGTGELRRAGERVRRIWEDSLSIERVSADVARMFDQVLGGQE